MDRRQQKSRRAIFRAFRSLLLKKRYDHITVQEIIDEADVGRTTFYAHFETKDMLLRALCDEMFEHVFEKDPCPWVGRDHDLTGKLAHALWHIRDSRADLAGVLLSDSGDLFMRYFKEHLHTLFEQYLTDFRTDVPQEFMLNHLVGSFSETVLWWMREGMTTTPEDTAAYFMRVCGR